MSILCFIFGHKLPSQGPRPHSGAEYCRLEHANNPYVDGIGRAHVTITGECPRCETRVTIGKTHLPGVFEK